MRRALCVGIDRYSFGPLQGCVNDVEHMSVLLAKNEDNSPNFECRKVIAAKGGTSPQITRTLLKEEIETLFRDKADVALLYFSGHGTVNNLGGYLVTEDAKKYDEGVGMADVLKLANDSKAEEVVIILDCCHSGHLGNMPAINNMAMLREGISILTASRGDQVSVEVSGGGLFTSLVTDALAGGAADLLGEVAVPAIYSFVETALGAWKQRPLFKSHVSKVIPLRKCNPPIDIVVLRELPALFPVPAEDISLSPEHETSCENKDDAKNKIFCKLQDLNRVHLVIPVGAAHMYDAAMQSAACRLTAAGRYYWRLARDGLI
ncbi:MAG TPA: caspase family protein [Candidatus Acidoferrum sp.]|jgi:hypothetical protein|nr:caspase family protein [Candidatus Acidoferrum sp.]